MATIIEVGTNSYISTADAAAFFATRLQSDAWDDASTADKEKALIQACRNIEALDPAGWHGSPIGTVGSSAAPLQWPRYSVPDRRQSGTASGLNYLGTGAGYYDADDYPPLLTQAQCEEALELLKEAADAGSLTAERHRARGITRYAPGRGSIDYGENPVRFGGKLHAEAAWRLLADLRRSTAAGVSGLW